MLHLLSTLIFSFHFFSLAESTYQPASLCTDFLTPKLFTTVDHDYQPKLTADRSKNAKLIVQGGQTLDGEVHIDPAKNAYLPILAATLLNSNPVRLKDVPRLRDIETFLEIFKSLGVRVVEDGEDIIIDASRLTTNIATCDLVKTMRASIVMLGPLLARFQGGQVGLPGGCPIGSRPIDIHINQLQKLGAIIDEKETSVTAQAFRKLKGTDLHLPFPSVGATQNLLMAAVLAEGKTRIINGAQEPEVLDLIQFLNQMGAQIQVLEDGVFEVEGVKKLNSGVVYRAIGDRIEASTYIIGALMTNSQLKVSGFNPSHLEPVLDALKRMGARLEVGSDSVSVYPSAPLKAIDIVTGPHPGFPTDVQAQLMGLMTQAEGISSIKETIFEGRFAHVHELNKMGADIWVEGDTAFIRGRTPLHGAKLKCTDLRAGITLIMSGLIASGESELSDIYYVDRGYNRFIEKFAKMGACEIVRVD